MARVTSLKTSPGYSLEDQLRQRFGFTQFKAGQREVIEATLAGHDTLAVMPTGQGKSLCFQLPASILPGLTVVVSPLIALMKDQVDALTAKGISAAAFHSGISQAARHETLSKIRHGRLRLLYVAPERIQHAWFMQLVREASPARLVIDEAHCISRWGHDFRPNYLRLAEFRGYLDHPPCLALTATATVPVQDDICFQLEFHNTVRIITGFHRPNLSFRVEQCRSTREKFQILETLVGQEKVGSTIVYCATRRQVEAVASVLARTNADVGYYHAGLDEGTRTRVHERFGQGRIRLLAATNAFGMGIDKGDVRQVVHFDIPGSIDAYYQEAGRAGRDGAPAGCTLLFYERDVKTQEYFVQKAEAQVSPSLSVSSHRERLQQMLSYVRSPICRQLTFLRYFGDRAAGSFQPCERCDCCLAGLGA